MTRFKKLLVCFALLGVVPTMWATVVPTAAQAESAGEGAHDDHAQDKTKTNPLSVDPDLAIFTAIVFVILLVILRKFAWGPIMEGLDKRESSIANQIEEAKQSNEQAKQTLAQYETKLAAATEEVKALLAEARQDAEATKDRIVGEAEQAARRERERAVEEIGLAKDAALRELAQKSVDSAVALAGQVLRREVDSQKHAQLIQDTLEKFPSRN